MTKIREEKTLRKKEKEEKRERRKRRANFQVKFEDLKHVLGCNHQYKSLI